MSWSFTRRQAHFLAPSNSINEPLKNSCIVFIIWKHLFGFLLDALFGLTWRILTTCLTLPSRHKPLGSFGFWLLMPLYASFNDFFSLCLIMAVIALLIDRSQSFASLHFLLSMSSTRASNSQKPSLPMCPPYIPITNSLFQSTFDLLLSNLQIKLVFVLCEN
jgi:hypothetical protein